MLIPHPDSSLTSVRPHAKRMRKTGIALVGPCWPNVYIDHVL